MRLTGALELPIPTPHQVNYRRLLKRSQKTKWEDRFRALCQGIGAPPWQEQYRFHATRLWRFDFAWPERKVAFEMEGGIWQRGGGGHSHPLGIEKDIEKYNAAALAGWAVIRITDKMLPVRKLFQAEAALLLVLAFRLDVNRVTSLELKSLGARTAAG